MSLPFSFLPIFAGSGRVASLSASLYATSSIVPAGYRSAFSAVDRPAPTLTTPNRTFYVSKSGSDSNDGSSGAPWLTIMRAMSTVTAGDLVLVGDGTYNEAVKIWSSASGNSSIYTEFRSANPGGAVIVPPANEQGVGIYANYFILSGFDVTSASGSSGVEAFEVHHVVVTGNHVHNAAGNGIAMIYCEDVWVENNIARENAYYKTNQCSGISIYQMKTISPEADTGQYRAVVRNNICYGNFETSSIPSPHTDGNGIIIDDFENSPTGAYRRPVLVENNLCYNNGGKGIQAFRSQYVTIRRNTCFGNNYDPLNPYTSRAEISIMDAPNCKIYNNIGIADISTNSSNVAFGSYDLGSGNGNCEWIGNNSWDGTGGSSVAATGSAAAPSSALNLLGVNPRLNASYEPTARAVGSALIAATAAPSLAASTTSATATSAIAAAATPSLVASTVQSDATTAGAERQAAVAVTLATSTTSAAATGAIAVAATPSLATSVTSSTATGAIAVAATPSLAASVTSSAATGAIAVAATPSLATSVTSSTATGAIAVAATPSLAASVTSSAATGAIAVAATPSLAASVTSSAATGAIAVAATPSLATSVTSSTATGAIAVAATPSLAASVTSATAIAEDGTRHATVDATLAASTASATATGTLAAAAAPSLAASTASAAGTSAIAAACSKSLAASTTAATATGTVAAAATASLAASTVAATGTGSVTASCSKSLAASTTAAAATGAIAAACSKSFAGASTAATGTAAIAAQSTIHLDPLVTTGAATGAIAASIVGSLDDADVDIQVTDIVAAAFDAILSDARLDAAIPSAAKPRLVLQITARSRSALRIVGRRAPCVITARLPRAVEIKSARKVETPWQ